MQSDNNNNYEKLLQSFRILNKCVRLNKSTDLRLKSNEQKKFIFERSENILPSS